MDQARAVELAYVIGEHTRTKALLDAIATATDVTLQTEGLRFNVTTRGDLSRPELPHLLMRDMWQQGLLTVAAQSYLSKLAATLRDDFGVTIEDAPPVQHQGSHAE